MSERTGGVPLFVEEVTRLLLERGVGGGAQAIPPTLQQSLAARLDRLGPARETAQFGAVLGRDFTFALLQAVSGLDEAGLHAALERLAEADLLIAEGAGPQANYRFKHALIQDAAYDSLLKSRRQALHRRAAEVLRDAEAEPEAVAHHFTEAGLDELAIEWWGKAGDQALRRSAFQEAIAHLGKAIAMADKGGGGQAAGVSGQQLHMRVAYGNALIAARGHGAPETTAAFARAHVIPRSPTRMRPSDSAADLRAVGRLLRPRRPAGDARARGRSSSARSRRVRRRLKPASHIASPASPNGLKGTLTGREVILNWRSPHSIQTASRRSRVSFRAGPQRRRHELISPLTLVAARRSLIGRCDLIGQR